MLISFRVDASLLIGTGHVMRCLSLAEQLRGEGHQIEFICRNHAGNLITYIQSKGYTVHVLINPIDQISAPTFHSTYEEWLGVPWLMDAEQTIVPLKRQANRIDWLVIDHYALNVEYEEAVQPFVRKILVIDDLANRKHACSMLLDHNYFDQMADRYGDLVDKRCHLLLGPSYAMLRKEFQVKRTAAKVRDGRIRHVLVSFGGVDSSGETMKALQAIWPLAQQGLSVNVLLGKMNPQSKEIMDFCRRMPNCSAYEHRENMRELMDKADLAIGAGGTTTWERCSAGLPSLVITTAKNQEAVTEHVARAGAIAYLGKSSEVSSWRIHEQVKYMMTHPELCLAMSARAADLVDGVGVERISKELSK